MWAWQEELTLLFGGGPAGDWSGVCKRPVCKAGALMKEQTRAAPWIQFHDGVHIYLKYTHMVVQSSPSNSSRTLLILQKPSVSIKLPTPCSFPPLTTTILLSFSVDLMTPGVSCKKNHTVFCDWSISLAQCPQGSLAW